MSRLAEGFLATRQRPRGRARLLAWHGGVALAAVLLCGAAPPMSGLEGLGRAISDEELSDMRGKFVRPSGVHFFGIEMLQSWQNGDGVTLQATLRFNVDFANGVSQQGATPNLQMDWSRTCESCGDPTMDVPTLAAPGPADALSLAQASDALIGDDLVTVSGLVQTQQIAGSDNIVQNRMNVAVVPASAQAVQPGSGSQSGFTQQFDNGDKIDFIVAQNEVSLAMTRGQDVVRSSVNAAANQAAQAVALQSSLNAIRNEMSILVGVDDLPGLDRIALGNALSAMKGKGM